MRHRFHQFKLLPFPECSLGSSFGVSFNREANKRAEHDCQCIQLVVKRRYRTYFLFPVGYIVYIDYAMWGLFLLVTGEPVRNGFFLWSPIWQTTL